MKKLIATLGLSVVASAAFAQGTVLPNNTSPTVFHTNSTAIGGGSASTPGSSIQLYYYEVLTAPSTTTTVDASLQSLLSATWSDTGILAQNSGLAGRMGGLNNTNANGGATANNWPAGAEQAFIVVGWSSSEGTTWAQVAGRLAGATFSNGQWSGGGLVNGGFLGATTIGDAFAAPPTSAEPQLFGAGNTAQVSPVTTPTDLYVVSTAVVPEPSTFALAGLGAAAMLIFRRRK
jgi:hypothetical protein